MARRTQSARAAGKVSIAVFVSRILGVVREQIFAGLFGAGFFYDAWTVAFRIPNLLRDLFAEGALSSAFVPTFTEHLQKKGKAQAWLLANMVINGLMVLLGAFALSLLLFPEFFVYLLGSGLGEVPGKVEVTATLLRILAPFLMMVALASVAMGMLNTLNHFFIPALAPALFNLALILSGFLLVPQFERAGILPISAMAVGALFGGFLQFAVQWPLLRKHGYRFQFRLSLKHEGIRRIARLLAPAVIGVSAVQINVIVNTQLASYLIEGSISWLNYAFRLIYLPIGLFGVAVGVVNLREVSVFAAQEKWEDFKETVANSVKLISLVALPSAVGLIVLAVPVVRVLFERGAFTSQDTLLTAYALMAYSLGLFAYSCVKIYVPSFYALNDTRTPVRISLAAVGINLVANLLLIWLLPDPYKHVGLAFGTAISVSMNTALLATAFRRRMGSLKQFHVVPAMAKTASAAVVMGLVVYFSHRLLGPRLEGPLFLEITGLSLVIGVGIFIYFTLCYLLGVEEMRYLSRFVRRR
jgi:putative peptidoglycan lipid II flippase